MAKKLKTHLTIPVFYHENDEGRIILDSEYMREYFYNELNKLYLETKIGMEEFRKNKIKEKLKK